MKKVWMIVLVLLPGLASVNKACAQADELAQLALDVEKLAQFKQILTDLKKGYQILSDGYKNVKDVSQGNFSIHKTFLDGLMQVSPAVKKYYKIPDIINNQYTLIQEYKAALKAFRGQGNFSPSKLDYISKVYTNLFEQSLQNLDELITVTTAGKMRMSDDERLQAIDRIDANMSDLLASLRGFNNDNVLLSIGIGKEKQGIQTLKNIHGIQEK